MPTYKKQLIILISATICLSIACNNKSKSTTHQDSAAAAVPAQVITEAEQKRQALEQLPPYTEDQLKHLLPVTLAGDSAQSQETGSTMGTGFTRAIYGNDSASTEVSIFDCGGTAGAGIYQAQYINLLENQSLNGGEYMKVIDFKGGKAIEWANSSGTSSSLTFLAADRFLVILEGKNRGADEIKKAANSLRLK